MLIVFIHAVNILGTRHAYDSICDGTFPGKFLIVQFKFVNYTHMKWLGTSGWHGILCSGRVLVSYKLTYLEFL